MDSGAFGTGLTFTQLIVGFLVVVSGIIAVKITMSFDLNAYLESRRKRYSSKCKNACTHFEFVADSIEDGILVNSFFVSPSGTTNYICQKCGQVRLHLDQESMEREVDYYAKNIKAYNKQNKKFLKYLKRAGHI